MVPKEGPQVRRTAKESGRSLECKGCAVKVRRIAKQRFEEGVAQQIKFGSGAANKAAR
jgi:hypothetical protein